MSQRTLLITGILMMVAGFLLGAVVGPIVEQAGPAASVASESPQEPKQRQLMPGVPGPGNGPGGGYYGRIPHRLPFPKATPTPRE